MRSSSYIFSLLLISSASLDALPQTEVPARLIAEGWKHRVWILYPVEKLKADQEFPALARVEKIQISAARNECEPFILSIRAEVPLREVAIVFGDLQGPLGRKLTRSSFTARRIGYIYVDEPSGTRIPNPMPYETGIGLYPDPLLKGVGSARPGRNLQFWVAAHVPADCPAGTYEGHVEIRFRKEDWMPDGKVQTSIRLPLVVHVRRFTLPERSPLRNAAFFNPQLPHGKASDALWMRRFYGDFVTRRQTPEPILPSPAVRVERDGRLLVEASGWEKTAASLLEELHLPHLFLPVWSLSPDPVVMQGIYFLWHYPAVTKQWWFGARIAGEDRQLTPEFKRRFGAYLGHMVEILKRRGWTDRVYLATMDEPYTYHTADRERDTPSNNYEVIRNYVTFVRGIAPTLKTFVTADPVPELIGFVDHWCLRNLKHAAAARERAEEHGEIFTFCDNYRTFIDYPAISARSLGWLAWKLGAQGWLTYQTTGALATAWEGPVTVYPSFGGATVWGLGQMFYPDPTDTDLVPSLRWEMMREGCDDYEYLWLLREALRKLPSGEQDDPQVHQARALLDTAADTIVGGTGDPETASTAARPNAQDNRSAHELRERIAELIELFQPD